MIRKYFNRLYWDNIEHSANIHLRSLMLSGYDKSWRKKWDNIKFRVIKFLAGE